MSGVSSPTLGRIALRLIRPWRCPLEDDPESGSPTSFAAGVRPFPLAPAD